jgi:hypothetical protein
VTLAVVAWKQGGGDSECSNVNLEGCSLRVMRNVWLTVNPKADGEFEALAQRLAQEAPDRADFERRLRVRYPAAVVRPRDLTGEPASTFYVYRDGLWSDGEDGDRD